jgi:hypothetical protein
MSSSLHPDSKLKPSLASSNGSGNESLEDLVERRLVSRREFLASSAGVTAAALFGGGAFAMLAGPAEAGPSAAGPSPSPVGGIGFASVGPNLFTGFVDGVTVPAGYKAKVLVAWGDSLTTEENWDPSTPMTEDVQVRSFGSHTDGMHYFPYPGSQGNRRGLLACNNEYCDPPLVNGITPRGTTPRPRPSSTFRWSAPSRPPTA